LPLKWFNATKVLNIRLIEKNVNKSFAGGCYQQKKKKKCGGVFCFCFPRRPI